jgi:transposase InsO family protein
MGQVLHGCARTTEAVRRAIQHSQESLRALARRHGVNPKTIAKWRARRDVADHRAGPATLCSTTLSAEEEAVVVAFRRHTLLALDDCLYVPQATIPDLTRSALHGCRQRHGISRLPETDGDKPARKRFKAYPIGVFHIDIAEVRTEQGKLHLFVAMDRTSKFAFAQLHEQATTRIAADFLRALLQAVPYRVHAVLTDNGQQFTARGTSASAAPLIREAIDRGDIFRARSLELACAQNGIEHRLAKPHHPWMNGQVERMNRTLKETTVRRYHYSSHEELRRHLALFLDAYNYARRLKTLKGLTPHEFICRLWATEPNRFTADPHHQMPGPNISRVGRRWFGARSPRLSLRRCLTPAWPTAHRIRPRRPRAGERGPRAGRVSAEVARRAARRGRCPAPRSCSRR